MVSESEVERRASDAYSAIVTSVPAQLAPRVSALRNRTPVDAVVVPTELAD
jgi:hypothetical protein